jgi:integrase/recombinase XerD
MKKFKSIAYNEIFKLFLQFMAIKNYKTGGGKMYPKAVEEFLFFMEQNNVTTLNFTSQEVVIYYSYLVQRPHRRDLNSSLSDSSINHHLFAIRLLFDLILDTQKVDSLPLLPKFHRGNCSNRIPLSVDEIILLYDLTITKKEVALISIAYGCGLRRSEIEQFKC